MTKKASKGIGTSPSRKGTVNVDADGFEVLGGGTGAAIEIGEVVEGIFEGIIRTMQGKKKGQGPVPFYGIGGRAVLGGTVLKQRIEDGKVKPGDYLRILRLEDATAKRGQNAAKLFDVRVNRK